MMSCPSQVAFIKNKIWTAVRISPLHGKATVSVLDPSDALIEVHLAALKWNMQQRRFGLVAEDCEVSGWNFEKTHNILQKVQLPVRFHVI